MNVFQNRKGQDVQKQVPCCIGRTINIFDLGSRIPRTKMLTEKPHQDASPVYSDQQDAVKKKAMDDKIVIGRKHSSKKSTGTPMKMLIAHEMSREPQTRQKPPNVVAKLMGLDMLPVQQSTLTARSPSGESRNHWQQDGSSYCNTLQSDDKSSAHESKCKDVYEVWQQPSRHPRFKDKLQPDRRYDDDPTEKRMALVHQKFTVAKRLATDENLLQSREFQEALEVLSSNRDLFLKFLEGPNAPFSRHHPEPQAPPVSQARRITVLKPSRTIEPRGEAQERRFLHPAVNDIDRKSSRSSDFVHRRAESMPEPTRIVVLKPNPGMSHETRAGAASLVTPSKPLDGREFHGSLGPDEATKSREIAREITRQMQEHMSSSRNNESLASSSLSNGYVGDESSFNRSECNYIQEECDNASDSVPVTPTSRHSWDCSGRLGSPASTSSFSRASCSPEPSVIKEAKKRLSERLAMVSSNGTSQEQSQAQRSSSTLGEMLSIAGVKQGGADDLTMSSRRPCGEEQGQRASTSCSTVNAMEGLNEDPMRNLARSKSVPVSSSAYENIGMIAKPKEVIAKPKSGMSSLKGKVSSLLLSRIRKAGREKSIPSCFLGSDHTEAPCERDDPSSVSFHHCDSEESNVANSEGKAGDGPCSSTSKPKASLPFEKSNAPEGSKESQDQPSPISILEAPFEDDASSSSVCQPSASIFSGHPQALSRSPPIGSISRTLTCENPRETLPGNSRFLSRECEEQERALLVQRLLSCADLLDSGCRGNALAGWHSLESPLDPVLLDDFLDRKEEGAKCGERRSSQRLLFDCVNAALSSIGQTALAGSCPGAVASKDGQARAPVAEEVLRLVKGWFSRVSVGAENQNLEVDKLVRGEMGGGGWTESVRLEVDEFSREIGGVVLEELVEEALADLTDGCL